MKKLMLQSFYIIQSKKIISLCTDNSDMANPFSVDIQDGDIFRSIGYKRYQDAELAFYKTITRQFFDQMIERSPDLPRNHNEKIL